MKNWKVPLLALLAIPLIGIASGKPGGPVLSAMPGIPMSLRVTCAEFAGFADEIENGRDAPVVRRLARDCAAAMEALGGKADVRETALAWTFLRHLADYRETILALNAERLSQRDANSRAPIRLVSQTGAYLIAAEMGLFDAEDAWAEAAGERLVSR